MSPDATRVSTESTPPKLEAVARPRLALGLIVAFVAAKLLIHLGTVFVTNYGIHRDEFLYLAMGEHLRFWCMDFPPAIAVLARVVHGVFGDTLFAVRFFPAVAGTFLLVLTALMTRELGGGRIAQGMAMFALLAGTLFLRSAVLFQPVVLDQVCWALGFLALLEIGRDGRPRWWMLLGLAGGLGLLTKFSIGFFAVGALVGLLCSERRAALAGRWPYLAALIALAVGSASIVGQFRLGFPVTIHMRDLQAEQLQRVTFLEFLAGQPLMLGPAFLLASAGLVYLLTAHAMRPYRLAGWTCVASFLLLLALHGKAYYIGPIYPVLFAAGATALGTVSGFVGRGMRWGLTLLIAGWGALSLPMGLPIVPPAAMARYASAIGVQAAVTSNRGATLKLPQDYADMLGWEEQVAAVAAAVNSLPVEQRARVMLIARNYGEAGALEFYGPRQGLLQPILLPRNEQLWPLPAREPCEIAVTIGISTNDLHEFFNTVRLFGHFDHPWMVPEERNVPICVAESPRRDLAEAWRRQER